MKSPPRAAPVTSMEVEQASSSRWWRVADRVGAVASFLCAIHCALLPFVLALLPFMGLEFLADHRLERAFVLFDGLLAVLVLPLSIPVLIFGVAASNAAVLEPAGFGAPLSILCALSLAGLVIGPLAAAASLRHGLD